MGGYVPNTKEQRQDMLKAIGLSSMEDLFVDIPQEVRLKGELEIPQGKSELEVKREMEDLAARIGVPHDFPWRWGRTVTISRQRSQASFPRKIF